MKSRLMMFLLLSASCGGMMAKNDNGKMSPFVRRAVMANLKDGRDKALSKDACLCAFVRLKNEKGVAELAGYGCKILDRQGDIVIASLPRTQLLHLAACKDIERIEAGTSCRLSMDTVATIVNALPVYAGANLPQAFTGRGVVVGIMDVGFDFTHPNFYDTSVTHHRVKAFWDQLSPDTIGSALPVGRDYTSESDILSVRRSADGCFQTHGTHTLGIAAGSGYDSAYRGMAYESDICAVSNAVTEDSVIISSADFYKYTTATDALGFKYIFDYAESQGLPCVASFSEGYYLQDDGDDKLFCEYLNRLTGPGRIIVVAAGNEGQHLTYLPKSKGIESSGSFVYSASQSASLSVSAHGDYTMQMISYGDEGQDTLSIPSVACLRDTTIYFSLVTSAGDSLLSVGVERHQSSFDVNKEIYHVTLNGGKPIYQLPKVAFVLRGEDADVEARLLSGSFQNGRRDARWSAAEASHNVLAPGCFPGIITVGATIHRTGFTNYQGHYYDYSQVGRNDGVRAQYSSVGPAIDGTPKPDIMAPGSNVVSSYSSFYLESHPDASDIASDVAHFDFNGRTYAWNSNAGTSMACPVVAGAIALWLQARPTLTPSDVMEVIARTSRKPELGLVYPNNYYGYGEIDVYRGLLDVLQLSGIRAISGCQPTGVVVSVAGDRQLQLSFANGKHDKLQLSLYNMAGQKMFSRNFPSGEESLLKVELPALQEGVYAAQLSGTADCTGSTLLRLR